MWLATERKGEDSPLLGIERELHRIEQRLMGTSPMSGDELESTRRSVARALEFTHRLARERAALDGGIDALEADSEVGRRRETDRRPRLEVGRAGYWFRVDSGKVVALHRRRPLRALLMALAERSDPSLPLGYDALVAAGWPNERVLRHAGIVRLRTAIATLRRMGLRDTLITTGDGYALMADVALES